MESTWKRGKFFCHDFEFVAGLLEENEKLERTMTEKVIILRVGCCIKNKVQQFAHRRLLADQS